MIQPMTKTAINAYVDCQYDHTGVGPQSTSNTIIAAEGNLNNVSGVIERPMDEHIRAYIRIPDGCGYRGL